MSQKNNVSVAFATQFESEVIHEWGSVGGQFKGNITEKQVKGKTVEFPKIGTVKMAERNSINGDLPRTNIEHGIVSFNVKDYFAVVPIDDFEEFKIDFNVRAEYIKAVTDAVEVKYDELIINVLASANAGGINGGYTQALDNASILKIREWFSSTKVPAQDRFVQTGVNGWGALLAVDKFTSSDFIGSSNLPFKTDREMQRYMGINWQENAELDSYKSLTNDKTPIFGWHKSAIAMGTNIKSVITQYNPVTGAWEILAKLSAGGGLIRPDCAIRLNWTS